MLTRTVVLLSLISLLNDMASEMLYPVMPFFLGSIGFGVAGIGLLEGIAEAAAGLSKGYFGKWSDRSGRRVPFVQWGYLLSAVAKPLLTLWAAPLWIFGVRTADRVGKGLRTGARDAMLSAEATPATRGRVFGFHRGLDTLGAAIGPTMALLFLWRYPEQYKALFLLAFLPGLAATATTLLLRDKGPLPVQSAGPPKLFGFLTAVGQFGSSEYRRLLVGLLAFALVNSSDVFMLLLLHDRGFSDAQLIGMYIFYNLVYALLAYPAGSLADRWGTKRTYIAGLFLFAAVYAGLALAQASWQFGLAFFFYGAYAAFTEGIAKAWIGNICAKSEMATAVGTYEGFRSLATLLSSSLAGLVWKFFGPTTLFFGTAAGVLLIAIFFFSIRPQKEGGVREEG